MLRKYFKHWAESELGEGICFMEAVGEEITRQVEIYGSTLIWCDRSGQSDDRFMLADKPLSWLEFEPEHEITSTEFEDVWTKAKTSCGKG
jgi:hypothetical protein